MKKRLLLIGAGLAAAFIIFSLWYQGYLGGERARYRSLKHSPPLVALYQKARGAERVIRRDPDKVEYYFEAGLQWKSIAEQMTGEEAERRPWFRRSLAVYQRGIERFGQKNVLVYLNAGKLAERLEQFDLAESYYRKVISLSPGDESGYIYLADLYRYKFAKDKAEIVAIYAEGIKRSGLPLPLYVARASYLKDVGDYAAALDDFRVLAELKPDFPGFKATIAELEAKLK